MSISTWGAFKLSSFSPTLRKHLLFRIDNLEKAVFKLTIQREYKHVGSPLKIAHFERALLMLLETPRVNKRSKEKAT